MINPRDKRSRPNNVVDGLSPRRGRERVARTVRPIHSTNNVVRNGSPQASGCSRSDRNSPSKPQVFPPITRKDMRLPGGDKRSSRQRFIKSFRKWTLRTGTAVLVIGILTGGYLFGKGYIQLHRVFGDSSKVLDPGADPSSLGGEGSGRINILLTGVGGPGHDGADLTDTMLVVSIDYVNHKVGILSVPRDLWVKEPNNFMSDYGKLNVAYEAGKYKYLGRIDSRNNNKKAIKAGFQSLDSTLSKITGIPIDYNILVNFHAFQQGIDSVGGITVNVPEQLYDPTMAWANGWNPVLATEGKHHMNGRRALMYVRSRETTSDFARGKRQRAVLLALKNKVLSVGTLSNPIKVSELIDALGDNVRTDIPLKDIQKLRNIGGRISSKNIKSLDLDSSPNDFLTTGNIGNQSVVKPKAGLFNYDAIRYFVRNRLRDGYLEKENARVRVLNGTNIPGLATQASQLLKSYGYRVAKPANAPKKNYKKTVLVNLNGGRDKYTQHYLERRYGVKAVDRLPKGISRGHADFVIILGQNEANLGK